MADILKDPYRRGGLSAGGLLELKKFNLTAFENTNIIHYFTKEAPVMRRSSMLSLPVQLVFPVQVFVPTNNGPWELNSNCAIKRNGKI
jgi:hypothetical protein